MRDAAVPRSVNSTISQGETLDVKHKQMPEWKKTHTTPVLLLWPISIRSAPALDAPSHAGLAQPACSLLFIRYRSLPRYPYLFFKAAQVCSKQPKGTEVNFLCSRWKVVIQGAKGLWGSAAAITLQLCGYSKKTYLYIFLYSIEFVKTYIIDMSRYKYIELDKFNGLALRTHFIILKLE